MANFEFESNNTTGTANKGVFDVTNGGQLNSITDKDVFRFDLSESALLGINFKLPAGASNSAFTISLLDEFGNIIITNVGGADFSDIKFSVGAGTYYFEIKANTDVTDGISNLTLFTTKQYGLSVTALPSVLAYGELEANNDAAHATSIVLGQGAPLVDEVSTATVIGNLPDVSDVDYYTFHSNETGVYQLVFNAPTNVTPDPVILPPSPGADPVGTIKEFFAISILDSNENVLVTHYVSATPDGGYSFEFALNSGLNPSGDYYVKIENGGSTNNINTQQYNFEINPVEPNESNSTHILGGALTDYLLGTSTSDIIKGNDGNDILAGMAGNDSLDGGLGNDTMKGGLGNDTYVVNIATDTVIENLNQGIDKVIASVNYTLNNNVENLVLAKAVASATGTLTGATSGTGNSLNNVIVGNELANNLSGLAGNDTLDGGLGEKGDALTGGTGNDTYYLNNVLDKVIESAGAGTDTVLAKVNVSALANNVENLTLLEVGVSAQAPVPIYGTGNAGDNLISGNSIANQLSGLAGNDTIYGGAGNDALIGGLGNDVLFGGTGSDFFIFEKALSATNVDTIGDFETGVDAINLSATIFTKLSALTGELDVDNFHLGVAAGDANDYIIYNSASGNLYYDADGSGAGSQVLFANLGALTALDYTDFIVS